MSGGAAEDEDLGEISAAFWCEAARLSVGAWFERVDTHANIADTPSRDGTDVPFGSTSCGALRHLGARERTAAAPDIPFFTS